MIGLEENASVPIFTNTSDQYLVPHSSFLTAAYAINLILGVPANGFILCLMVTRGRAVMTLEFFSLNLAVSEMLFGLSNICCFISFYHNSSVFLAFLFFYVFLLFGRPLFQTCICVERYLAVIHPVLFLRLKPLKYRVACCSVVWLLLLGLGFIDTFMDASDTKGIPYLAVSLYVVLFSVNLFCCFSVLRALRKPGPGEGEREKGRSSDPKMKAFKVILVITVSTIICYLPFVIIIILKSYITMWVFHISYTISSVIAIITGFVHPFLYLHRAGKIPCMTV